MGVRIADVELFEQLMEGHLRTIAEFHEQTKGQDMGLDNIMTLYANDLAKGICRVQNLLSRARKQERRVKAGWGE